MHTNRRAFLAGLGGCGAAAWTAAAQAARRARPRRAEAAAAAPAEAASPAADDPRPNILWLVLEDTCPHFGCYGDPVAKTPTVDALAREGVVFDRAYSGAPVCAPSRSTLIMGMYANSVGSQHMRSHVAVPEGAQMYPAHLRKAGYYCTNNAKKDYNLDDPPDVWDASNKSAHWRQRRPGQPFFAVFNFEGCHESQIWPKGDGRTDHDPAKVRVPAYHPDTPAVRRDWAQHFDNLTRADAWVAGKLGELEADGLADRTIVWVYGDNGTGMPRGKRWLYDLGLRVPLVIRFPPRFRDLAPAAPGARTDRAVSFVDFGPTLLSLVGAPVPPNMQGRAFLGPKAATPTDLFFSFRDRMDERYDLSRTVCDARYIYIRNFMPHRPQAQYLEYMYKMPTMQEWARLYREGKLTAAQRAFFEPKPVEELYDTRADPDNVCNLAGDPAHREALVRLRKALRDWMEQIRDTGLLPEPEMLARSAGRSPYDMARDGKSYDYPRVRDAAEAAGELRPDGLAGWVKHFDDADSAVRYWAAVGCVRLGKDAAPARPALEKALADRSWCVRIAAAEAVAALGGVDRALPVLIEAMKSDEPAVARMAGNVLDFLGEQARPALDAVRQAAKAGDQYVKRLAGKILGNLGAGA